MKSLVFINNKGGVGKTLLVYHLAWMFSELGVKVIAADLDPQANLSAMFLPEERLEDLWPDKGQRRTILGAVQPLIKATGDVRPVHIERVRDRLGLIVGDLGLSAIEGGLSAAWPQCLDRDERSFRVASALYRVVQEAAGREGAKLVLLDVGPNLGAINRSALIGATYVAVPLAADLFSLQGLKNLGPTLREWRSQWKERLKKRPKHLDLPLPEGRMEPVGYIVMQHAVRLDRPVRAYERWMKRIPETYVDEVLEGQGPSADSINSDPNCLSSLKNYRSLMPLAQDALKPMFALKPADGALGAHMNAVQSCYRDFKRLAEVLADRCGVVLPT